MEDIDESGAAGEQVTDDLGKLIAFVACRWDETSYSISPGLPLLLAPFSFVSRLQVQR